MRIVLDTNILVSALISKGTPPYALYQAWRAGKFALVTSSFQIAEARRVFEHDKLKKFVTPAEARAPLANIEADSIIVIPAEGAAFSCDPDDNVIIATAIAGTAD